MQEEAAMSEWEPGAYETTAPAPDETGGTNETHQRGIK